MTLLCSADKKAELRRRYGDRNAPQFDAMVESFIGDIDSAEFEAMIVSAAVAVDAAAVSVGAPAAAKANGKVECPACKKQFKSAAGRDDHMKSTGHSAVAEVCVNWYACSFALRDDIADWTSRCLLLLSRKLLPPLWVLLMLLVL